MIDSLFKLNSLFDILFPQADGHAELSEAKPNVELDELISLRYHANKIRLPKTNRVSTFQSGARLSPYKGRGIDFAETRDYHPGDDIRHMDWRVTARTGKPHTKIFEEERERPVYLIIDFGPSMYFGSRVCFKSTIAAKLSALIAWSASFNGDKVGAFIARHPNTIELAARRSTRGVLPILHALACTECSDEPADLSKVLQRVRKIARPGSLVFILSDFYNLNRDTEHHLNHLAKHTDVATCFIYDPLEKEPPPSNEYAVSNGRSMSTIDTSSLDFCIKYRTHFLNHENRLKKIMRNNKIRFVTAATDDDLFEVFKRIGR